MAHWLCEGGSTSSPDTPAVVLNGFSCSILALRFSKERVLDALLTKHRWIEWVTYTVVLLVIFGPSMADANAVIGADVDLRGTLWYYWWFKNALLTGGSTEVTELFCYPYGVDIHAQTGGNFVDAVLSIPFQMLFGSPGYYAVFVAALFAANTVAFQSLLSTIGASPVARMFGTLLWMVNPFVFHELIWGRPTQAFLLFSILALRTFWKLHREPHFKTAIWLGVWVGLQGLTYWYAGYFLAFVLGWLALFLGREAAARIGVGQLLRLYAAGAATCGLVLSHAIYRILAKASSGSIPMESTSSGNWLVPDTLANYVGGFILGYQVTEGHGYPMMQSWLWAPLFLAVAIAGRKRKLWLGAAVLTLAIATGPEWTIGDTLFRMPQYMVLYHILPFFERLWFPYRILAFTFIALSVAGALLLDKHKTHRWAVPVAALLWFAGVAESVQLRSMPLMTTDMTPTSIAKHIREQGGPVINVPFDSGDASVVLQVDHGQPILSGMGENSSYFKPAEHLDRMKNNPFLRYLDELIVDRDDTQTFTDADREAIQSQGFRWLILYREQVLATQTRFFNDSVDGGQAGKSFEETRPKSAADVQKELSEHLGPALMVDGPYVLWDLQNRQTESCCPDEYDYIKNWKETSNPHFEALEKLGRADNNVDTQAEVDWLDPNEVPPEVVPMPPHGGPGAPGGPPGPPPGHPPMAPGHAPAEHPR